MMAHRCCSSLAKGKFSEASSDFVLIIHSDGNIRYFEYTNDKFEFLSEYKSVEPQRGIAFLPKRGVDLHENEVMRAYKTVNDAYIEPVQFIVPRRAEVFQSDIYPPATGTKPALSGTDYFAGKETSYPPKISLESVYEGQGPQEVPAESKPRSAPTPEPAATPSPTKTTTAAPPSPTKQEPTPTPSRAPMTSLKDNQASMSAMASKFADKEEAEPESDSSFEEIPKPIERPHARQAEARTPSPTKTSSAPAPAPAAAPVAETAPTPAQTLAKEPEATASPSGGSKSAAEGIRGILQEMRGLLTTQGQQLKEQAEKIEALTKEVAALKGGASSA